MKKALLTGSTGGLGSQVAKLLAEDGWNLILLNRNKERSEKQVDSLSATFPDQTFEVYIVDLMDIEAIARVAKNIADAHPQIRTLYNIAGFLSDKRVISPQEIEGHFALNSLAPYLLIQALRSSLQSGTPQDPSYIVNFSTQAVSSVKTLSVDKLVDPETIGGLMDAYAKTKAALHVMAGFLQDELAEENIRIFSVDPGATKTNMTSGNQGMPWFIRLLVPFVFGDPEKQARKVVDGVKRELQKGNTGTFISNGKPKDNPDLASSLKVQGDLRTLLDGLVEKHIQ